MTFLKKGFLVLILSLSATSMALSAELSEIFNYIEYSPTFSSAGQPSLEQLDDVKAAEFERIIYIAFSNGRRAISDEDAVVKELGMDYIHIPVIWDAPTKSDFYAFASAMQQEPERKTLLHCAANFRASAFSMLYRVLHEDVSVAAAKADMNKIWQPNDTWKNLIFAVLEDNGLSGNCRGCDWTVDE
jgi:protein tyrosine phosphatase (PTP) superfamily phosphohydrolase (DUF442 family)